MMVALLTLGVSLVAAGPALADDVSPPQITALSLTPSEFNTESADQVLTLTVTLTDDQAGVASERDYTSSGGCSSAGLHPLISTQWASAGLTRISGDANSGVYTATFTLPKGSKEGVWNIAGLGLLDKVGNYVYLTTAELEAQFGVGSASATNVATVSDVSPPQITALSLTPSEFNTESADQVLTLTVTLTDDQAGVASERDYTSSGGCSSAGLHPLISTQWASAGLTRISGDANSGVYTATFTLPKGSKEGVWNIAVSLLDKVGNYVYLTTDELRALLPDAEGLTVVNTAATNEVIIDRELTIESASTSVTFPSGTVVTRTDGGSFRFSELTAAPFVLDESVPTGGLEGEPVATLRLGIPGIGLSFDRPVAVSLEVGSAYEGQTLLIQSLVEGGTTWANETTCVVVDGRCTFTVSHATRFVASLIRYEWGGFLSPLASTDLTYRCGRTIPVKFSLLHPADAPVTDAAATLTVTGPEGFAVEPLSFRYSAADDLYICNLKTTGWKAGTYLLTVELDDDSSRSLTIRLR